MDCPVRVEPVNTTALMSGSSTRARPVPPSPVTMFTVPGGNPASWKMPASMAEDSGAYSLGFQTTVSPMASA